MVLQKIVGEPAEGAVGFALTVFHENRHEIRPRFLKQRQVVEHEVDGVVDLMRHPGHQRAEGFHLLGLLKLLPGLLQGLLARVHERLQALAFGAGGCQFLQQAFPAAGVIRHGIPLCPSDVRTASTQSRTRGRGMSVRMPGQLPAMIDQLCGSDHDAFDERPAAAHARLDGVDGAAPVPENAIAVSPLRQQMLPAGQPAVAFDDPGRLGADETPQWRQCPPRRHRCRRIPCSSPRSACR